MSVDVRSTIAKGEGQAIEFDRQYPVQAQELAKKVAAFSTSNDGVILLGVDNDGEVFGLEEMDSLPKRDDLKERVAGVCRNTVKPAVTPELEFAELDGKVILQIRVRRGTEPLYYVHNVPYLRHVTQAQAAQPHEVIEAVRAWLEAGRISKDEENADVVGSFVSEIVLYAEQFRSRATGPEAELLEHIFRSASDTARELAAMEFAIAFNWRERLLEFAATAERLAEARVNLSAASWEERNALASTLAREGRGLLQYVSDTVPPRPPVVNRAESQLRALGRKLEGDAARAECLAQSSSFSEFRQNIANVGARIARLALWPMPAVEPTWSDQLYRAGSALSMTDLVSRHIGSPAPIVAAILSASSSIQNVLNERFDDSSLA